MDRTLLSKILEQSPGLQKSDTGFLVADEHRASIYLGGNGPTTSLTDLVRVQLHEAHVEAEAKDRTVHFVIYEPIFGISIRRPREEDGRTGF